jgi:hypothetical protein
LATDRSWIVRSPFCVRLRISTAATIRRRSGWPARFVRLWEATGQVRHLETSAEYYRRGFEQGVKKDRAIPR